MRRVEIFRGDVRNFSVVGYRRQKTSRGRGWAAGGLEGVEHLMPVRGDVQNSRISIAEHLNVVGAVLLQSLYGIRYSNEHIARQKCGDVGGLLPLKNL